MSTTREEVTARMGMDNDPFIQAMNRARVGVSDFAKHTSEHFDKAALSGRKIHSLLEQLSSISPAAGLALTAAFSLPMAAIAGVGYAIETIKEGITEAREEAKRMAKETAEAFEKVSKIAGDPRARFRNSPGDPHGEAMEAAKTGVAVRNELLDQTIEKEKKLREEAFAAQSELLEMDEEAKRYAPQRVRELEETVKKYDEIRESIRKQDETLNEHQDKLKAVEEFERKAQEAAERTIEKKKKAAEEEEKLDRLDEERHKNLLDRIKEQAEKAKEAQSQYNALQALASRISEHMMSPFGPSMEELSMFGGPNGALASQIQAVERFGKNANMAGRKDLVQAAYRTLYGYDYDPDASRARGGIAQRDANGNLLPSSVHAAGLRDRLRATGIMAPEQTLKEVNDRMAALVEMAARSGIKIDVLDK